MGARFARGSSTARRSAKPRDGDSRRLVPRGVPISGAQAVLRNLVGAVVDGVFPFFISLPALASMVVSSKFQRLGDLAAGTMVVIEERRWRRGVTRIDDAEVLALIPWLPSRIAAGSDLARVLSDYVEARKRFGPLRRAEMAERLAGPLRKRFGLSDQHSADAVLCAPSITRFLWADESVSPEGAPGASFRTASTARISVARARRTDRTVGQGPVPAHGPGGFATGRAVSARPVPT